MSDNIDELYQEINQMNNAQLILTFDNKFRSLWDTAKALSVTEPKKSLRLLAMLSLKARGLPETWRETAKNIYIDTNQLIRKIGGSDYIFFLQAAELYKLENDHLSIAYHHRWAADAIGRDGFKVMTMTYEGSNDNSERIRCLLEAVIHFQTGGDSEQASQCYIEAMHLKRNQATGLQKVWLSIGWLLWGWGERPLHVVASASLIITLYALGYMVFGIKPDAGSRWEMILNSMYFSIITFATVGYGDITPGSSVSKLLAASQGLMGIFFTGLFLVTFVKRSTR